MKKTSKGSTCCPVDYAFQRLGGKHKGRILLLLQQGTLRYGELKRIVTGISTKMLTQALKELEEDGLIRRKEYVEMPPKVEYSLTQTAYNILPAINNLKAWGELEMGNICPSIQVTEQFSKRESSILC